MASPEEVAHLLPDTLPEDFSEWDGEAAAAGLTGFSAESHGSSESSRPISLSTARGAGVAPGVGRPRGTRSSWPVADSLRKAEMAARRDEDVAGLDAHRMDSDRSSGEHHADPWQSAERDMSLSSAVEWPRATSAVATAASVLKEQRATSEVAERLPSRAFQMPEVRNAAIEMAAAPATYPGGRANESAVSPEGAAAMSDAALLAIFRENAEEEDAPKTVKSKQIIFAAVAACVLLLLLLAIPWFHRGASAAVRLPAQPASAASDAQQTTNLSKPQPGRNRQASAQEKSGMANASATSDMGGADNQADSTQDQPEVQSAMMNEQLTAARKIPQEVSNVAAGSAPPPVSMNADGIGGMGSSSIFKEGQPMVQAAAVKPLAVSAGVANGMLIDKKTPVYPVIARQARISGTVVLNARISKTGSISDVRVVSGPAMLRQSAVDAVRTWRYKPYQLNHQPTEVETTINVVFSLGG